MIGKRISKTTDFVKSADSARRTCQKQTMGKITVAINTKIEISDKDTDGNKYKDNKGETTPFQALSTALSGTVGTGNIGGVAMAIFIGGPAALFWMWITAFLGMTTKYVEVFIAC